MRTREPWSHNSHFHRFFLGQLPAEARSALDIGCGDGTLSRALAQRGLHVLAIDPVAAEIEKTRLVCAGLDVEVRQVALLEAELPADTFDVVTALASLHHMPFEQGIVDAARVLSPGGRLFVLGIWIDRDLGWNLISSVWNRLLWLIRGRDVMGSPATMPTLTLAELRAVFDRLLPGSRLRRHLLWRYSVVWDKP